MKNLSEKLKKLLAVTILVVMLTASTVPATYAETPSAPEAPSAPSAPSAPLAPNAPSAPETPSNPNTIEAPSYNNRTTPTPEPTKTPRENKNRDDNTSSQTENTSSQTENNAPQTTPTPTPQGTSQNETAGDALVNTGNATNTGLINTLGNTNTGAIANPNGGASVINSGNGAGSTNNSSVGVSNNNQSNQVNNANVANGMILDSSTGQNTANDNMGNATVKTGDANTTGTVITGVNTNVDGVAISEFNVADDHTGDLVLDFGSNCISGCGNFGNTIVGNTNNGAGSTNNSTVNSNSNDTSFQTNTANVDSSLVLSANSGQNQANRNGGGDNYIQTGDANVAANALTFVNNNIAGNVVLGVVNIFGDLIGDIIIPDSIQTCATCNGSTTAGNTGNGTNSNNTTNVNNNQNSATFQNNDAVIENNLILDGNTGNNEALRNGGNGVAYIDSGDTNVQANVLNIANSNIAGDGVWWLAIVNQAGQWVGKIIGSPDGANMAGSAGTEFVMNPDGTITAQNSNNAAGSNNTTNVNNNSNETTVQNNTAKVTNNLDLSANTGENQVNDNIGGDNVIKTGDAQVIANLVNFVNNNVSGGGKLMVTVVNVFGSWMGDLVTPGQKKQEKTAVIAQKTEEKNIGGSNQATPTPTTQQSTVTTNLTTQNVKNETTGASTKTGNSAPTNTNVSSGTTDNKTLAIGYDTNGAVKGISAHKNVSRSISVNLAWGLILIPLAGIILYRKKFSQLVRLLPQL